MTLLALRLVFLILCVLGGWSISQLHEEWARHPLLAVLVGFAGGLAIIGIDRLSKGFSVRGLSAATFGLFVGGLISYFIGNSVLFNFIDAEPKLIAQIVMYVVCSYLAMVIALRGKDDFNLIIPYVRFRRVDKPERLVLLDTSIIIDGRIQDICAAGFLEAVLVVPRFVLQELQHIADAPEESRSVRGRRGLEVLQALQRNPRVEVKIHDNDIPEITEVDSKLIELAKRLSADVVTNDYNLCKIAELQSVRALNVNELARALRPVILPGEKLHVKLVKEGREPDQALAYLDDGTLIVVNRSRRLIGREVEAQIVSVLQTAGGRMAFAELGGSESAARRAPAPELATAP